MHWPRNPATGIVDYPLLGTWLIIVLSSLAFSACISQKSRLKQNIGDNIRFETGAATQAREVADALPRVMAQVENGHQHAFKQPPVIYVFSTEQKFEEITGYHGDLVAGLSTPSGLFLSPQEPGQLKRTLTHELSHVLLRQWVGTYRFHRTPVWFREGLATWAAAGGGAESVTLEQAEQALRTERSFVPTLEEGAILQKGAPQWNLSHHMFYRQSSLFIDFLAVNYAGGWSALLREVHQGSDFAQAFTTSFDTNIEALWASFLHSLG